MTSAALIVAMAVVTYLSRAFGFVLAGRRLPPAFERFLRYVPVAAFAALIAPAFEIGTAEMWPRLIAGTIGAVIALRWENSG